MLRILLLVAAVSTAGAAHVCAQIWINPLTTGAPIGTYYLGDSLSSTYYVNMEIGQSSWNYAQIGFGTNINSLNWAVANWYEDVAGSSNKRVRRDIGNWKFTGTGNFGLVYQAKANSGDAYTSASAGGWGNGTNYPSSFGIYFTVNALNNPTSVSLSGQTTNSATVSWTRGVSGTTKDTVVVRHTSSSITDPTGGTTYNSGDSTGGGTVIYRGSGTSVTDSNRTAGTTYYYKVYAENYSYYSSGVSTNTATIPLAPGAPTGSSVATTSFTANWSNPGGATSYYLDVATDSGFTSFVTGYNNKSVSGTSDSVTGLTAGTTYYVRVRAVSAGGTSASSAALTQVTVPTAPNTPTAGSVTASSFAVSWSAVTGATSYKLDVATDSGFTSKLSSYNDVTATSPTTVSGLNASTTYYVRVRAVSSGGTGANSGTLTQSTAASATAPAAPTGLTVTPGNQLLSLSFAAGADGGSAITNYEYSTNGGSSWTARSPASTATSFDITGLTNGTSYDVQVRAVNAIGTGTATDSVAGTPRTTPGAPTGLSVTPGNGQLTASFTAPASNGGSALTNYEYSTNGGSSFTAVSPASTSTSITITGLSNGTSYNVQVRAVNAAGSGTATDSVAGTPRTTPTVTTGSSGSVAAYSASLAGNITATGGANATVRGVEYSTNNSFSTGTGTQSSSSGDFSTGAFTNSATGLVSGTTYYYRAFASNAAGTSYGAQSNFTTLTVPGGKNPAVANATTAFLGDTVRLDLDAWQTLNGTNRSYATVFGRYDNADLSVAGNTVQGAGRDPGSSADGIYANTPQLTNAGTFYWAMRVSYGVGNDYWFDASRPAWSDLALSRPGAATLSIVVSALNNPTTLAATNASSTQIDLTWVRGVSGNAKSTMIVRSADTNFTAPTPGTAYAVGSTALGGDTVVYNDSGISFSDTGLSGGTTYYYKFYAENYSHYSAGDTASAATTGTPTVTINGSTNNVTTAAFTTTYGTPSAAQNFTVGGSNLTTNIVVTAPTGFQVSTNESAYTNAVTFTQSGGSASGTLYLRLSAEAAAGSYNSVSVTLASTNAATRTITTPSSGNTVAKSTPTIVSAPTASASVIKGDRLSNGLLSGGSASTAGSFSFDDTATEQTASGSKDVTFTPTDTANFNTVATSVSVTVDPVPDPTNVTATATGTTAIGLTHDLTSSRNVMIVRRAGSAVDFTPADNTNYSDGQDVGTGHIVVRGSLAAGTSSDTGLSPSTTYHYKIFSENWGWYSPGVTTSATTAAPPPTITVTGAPSAMTTNYGTASAAQSFSVSGSNLSASLSVAAPAGFEVSQSSGSGYGPAVTLTPSSGTVASTTIYVRLKSNASPGANSGDVTASSTGATSQTVAVSGTVNVASMSMTINSPAGSMNADYTTSKLFADELAGTTNNVTITFSPGLTPDEVEVWTNLNNRERAAADANSDGIPDGIIPPDPPTDKPVGYTAGAYPTDGYFQAHPMSGSAGSYTLTINANKTGAYRLTARYRMNGGPWIYYNYGGKRDHAITVTPVLARNMNVYEINVLNVNATGDTFGTRSTFESLTNSANGRVNLDSLRGLGVNTLWFQPIHPNGVEGREAPGGTPYDPGSPYAVKNFFEVMEQMSQGNDRSASMAAFTNFVTAADGKGVNVMLDAPFNHTAYDCELDEEGLALLAAAGVSTGGWSATDKIKDREARFYSKNNSGSQYAGPASSAANVAVAPDRNDFGKWSDVIDVFFGRYSALVTGNPSGGAELNRYKNEEDSITLSDLQGGSNTSGAVTRAVWQYFARYVPYWLEKTGLPAGSSATDQAYKGIDGLRADFGQGMPPQFWEYVINVARAHKWSFVFMSESLDGGEVTYRSNRHFDVLNENIVFPWQNATNATTHRAIFEDRRSAYGQGLVLLNNTSHDEAGWADPWQAFLRYAVGSAIDGAPMIMYGQEIGTAASLSFSHYEVNFGKSIPHFKRYNSMNPQWLAWSSNSLGVQNLRPAYSGVGLAREFSPALRSSSRYFLNPINSNDADERIFAVAKYETANASPSSSDVVLAFVNLTRSNNVANTFGIPSGLGTLLGLEANKLYNVRNIAAYLGPNNEYPNRRNQFLWNTPRSGGDILANGIYVALNGVPTTDAGWVTNPHEPQYLKVYAAPVITTSNTPSALSTTFGSASANTSFSFSATDVHDGVTVAAPAGFHISTNASTGFTNSLSLSNTGTIGSTTLYVRLAGTNAVGTYSGNITLSSPGGNSTTVATASSSVAKAVPSITTAPAASAITYGQALSASSLSGGAASVPGSFAFTAPATAPNAGTANQSVTFTPTDTASYDSVVLEVGVTVNPKALSITAPSLASRAYNGTTSPGTLTVGTLSGLVGSQTLTVSGAAADYPSANAGTYAGIAITYSLGDGTNGGLASNYSVSAGTATGVVTSASVSSGDITLTRDGDNWSAGASGVGGFTLSYSGRTANDITTTYGPSATAPTSAGYYTVTATSSDANYSGTKAENYFVTGPLAAADSVVRPAGNSSFGIPQATLLQNDKRIDGSGNVQTNNLSVSAVSPSGGNTVSLGGVMVNFTAAGSGVETFTYTLTDAAAGKSATTTVTVTPQAAAESFTISGTPGTPVFDGEMTSVTMTFTGTPKVTYYIYYKGELSEPAWKTAGGVYSENSSYTVEISEDGNHVSDWTGSMFFRAVR